MASCAGAGSFRASSIAQFQQSCHCGSPKWCDPDSLATPAISCKRTSKIGTTWLWLLGVSNMVTTPYGMISNTVCDAPGRAAYARRRPAQSLPLTTTARAPYHHYFRSCTVRLSVFGGSPEMRAFAASLRLILSLGRGLIGRAREGVLGFVASALKCNTRSPETRPLPGGSRGFVFVGLEFPSAQGFERAS